MSGVEVHSRDPDFAEETEFGVLSSGDRRAFRQHDTSSSSFPARSSKVVVNTSCRPSCGRSRAEHTMCDSQIKSCHGI
jgi:hypothetical protein